MHSKQAIYDHLLEVLVESFEIDASDVQPEAKLVEDLDIDSIDAVDIAVHMQKLTGEKIQPPEFKGIRTVQDLVDAIHNLLSADPPQGAE